MFLNEIDSDKTVKILRLLGGRRQQGRLASLGVYPGSELTLLDKPVENAPCRAIAKGSVITLCPNMLRNIEVEYVNKIVNDLDTVHA